MPERFNEPQQSRILSGISYIDKLLVDIEEVLTSTTSNGFPKYKNPLSPTQVRVVRDYITRVRQQIKSVLEALSISLPPPKFDSTHSIRVNLQFVEVALEEIAPKRLTGYGQVPEALRAPLEGGLQELKGIVRQLDAYLSVPPSADLADRIGRLRSSESLTDLLRTISDVIDRHRLVEFRTAVSDLLDKLGHPAYEVAFFGRVSAGKSSLLNWLVGADLLPTGVTPVTSVPTRIRNSAHRRVLVKAGDGRLHEYEIERLPDFVTEARNPANEKRVTRLLVELPIDMLPEEVVLVDTPGLGSLAVAGTAETMAYLPHCDLGVVLIDASSNLHSDDVLTVDALRAASAEALIVLSKSDLVSSTDLDRLVTYTRTQVEQQLQKAIPVSAVSIRPGYTSTVQQWIEKEMKPRLQHARQLAAQSNYRKIVTLGQAVLRALEASTKRSVHDAASPGSLRSAEQALREVAHLPDSETEKCYSITATLRSARDEAVRLISDEVVTGNNGDAPDLPARTAVRLAHSASQEVFNRVLEVGQTLDRALELVGNAVDDAQASRSQLTSLVTSLPPAPEFPGCPGSFTRPVLAAFSKSLAKSVLRSNIAESCGTQLSNFFESYARALELWFRDVLLQLERQFNATAEIYRAQLTRLLSSDSLQVDDAVGPSIAKLRDALQIEPPSTTEYTREKAAYER